MIVQAGSHRRNLVIAFADRFFCDNKLAFKIAYFCTQLGDFTLQGITLAHDALKLTDLTTQCGFLSFEQGDLFDQGAFFAFQRGYLLSQFVLAGRKKLYLLKH